MGGSSGSRDGPERARTGPGAGLSVKIALGLGLLSLIPALVVSALTFRQTREAATAALERQGVAVATLFNYSFEVLLEHGAPHQMQRVVANSAMIADIRKVTTVDLARNVLASSDRSEVGAPSESPLLRRFLDEGGVRPLTSLDAHELTIVRPLVRGQVSENEGQSVVGAIELTLDRREVEASAWAAALRMLRISAGLSLALTVAMVVFLQALCIRPLGQLAAAARAFHDGDRSQRSRLRRKDELGRLSESLDALADEAGAMFVQLEEQISARWLPPPLLPVHRGVVVMSLLGYVDSRRAELIEISLVAGIETHAAQIIILDLTGVPAIHADVAASLMTAKGTAELLGASVIMAGLSPDVTTLLRSAGLDASGVAPCPDVASALRAALRRLELVIQPARPGARREVDG